MKQIWLQKTALGTFAAIGAVGLAAGVAVSMASADSMDDLVKAAKAEGELTIIAVPHD